MSELSDACGFCIQVGDPAPKFSAKALVGPEFMEVSYEGGTLKVGEQTSKDQWLVLFFYPLDFTFVCPTEIIAFSDRLDEFSKINTKVVSCSIDSHFSHLAWTNQPRKAGGLGEIRYPMIADVTKQIACDYSVLLESGIAARGLFIIDNKGILQSYTVNNLAVGRSVDETLRLVQGYQFVAEHGEVCPANWTPGGDSMKPDPTGSKEYFSKVNK